MRFYKFFTVLALTLMMMFSCVSKYDGPGFEAAQSEWSSSVEEWRDLKFGVYLNWGFQKFYPCCYEGASVNDPKWALCNLEIPYDVYNSYLKNVTFEPRLIENMVALVKRSGARYVILDAKGPDGFCMFKTAYTKYNVVESTPAARDILGELISAMKKEGVKVGVAYSIIDWNHVSQQSFAEDGTKLPADLIPRMNPDLKQSYIEYIKNQGKELIQNYKPDLFYLENEFAKSWWTIEDRAAVVSFLKDLNPKIVINKNEFDREANSGDIAPYTARYTNDVRKDSVGAPWEYRVSVSKLYGYNFKQKEAVKKDYKFFKNYIDAVAKNGSYLITLDPDKNGVVSPAVSLFVDDIGEFNQTFGNVIFGSRPAPFSFWTRNKVIQSDWRRHFVKENKLYIFSFYPPYFADNIVINEIPGKRITKVYFLDQPYSNLTLKQGSNGKILVKKPKHWTKIEPRVIVAELADK